MVFEAHRVSTEPPDLRSPFPTRISNAFEGGEVYASLAGLSTMRPAMNRKRKKERPDITSGRTLTRPPLARADSAVGPGAIMRQLSAECQSFEQQFLRISNDRAETLRIV